ncbi:CPBP family glutamic-type intramembrane protease, partial [Viridibacillus sp. NPDC096237]|uniref:CPBP family glutamic-type intramembrane protease n=1 Tax=Viridibacillus sp. NPDC096237 TaxID=3390721 RepID=UPI003CFC79BA
SNSWNTGLFNTGGIQAAVLIKVVQFSVDIPVFINGLLFALLFYFTSSLIPSMIAHAIYNLGIGI